MQAYDTLPEKVDYNYHIKPILSDRCYTCHGPDAQTRKAGLRLDIESEAFKKLESGNHAFVKGNVKKSEAIQRLLSDDPNIMMPPPESELKISEREIALLAKWIEQGSEWKEHWSFLPIEVAEIPELNNDWQRYNPIDYYVQEKLLEQGMSPSEEADIEVLLRRVSMDLTGLPPTIEEIDDFLKDESDSAYEKVVDRLLKSDACAERLAQEWMDIARYSDSHGVTFDGARTSWPYRDWVIDAFKNNIGYDEFITYQLAGDLVENSDDQAKIATSFLRMNPLEASGGSIDEEFRISYVNERASVTGTAFLGLTLECAQCHDHKFDPISQEEFYQVSAFFNNTEEYGLAPVDADRPPTLMLLSDSEKEDINKFMASLEKQEADLKRIEETAINFNKALPKLVAKDYVAYYPFNSIQPYKKELKRPKPKPTKKTDSVKKKEEVKKEMEDKKEMKKRFIDMQMLDNNKKAEANLKITLSDGKYGNAASFNEEFDIITLREVGLFNHMDPFSVSAWVNTEKDSTGASQTIIGNTGNVFRYHRGWEMLLDSMNRLSVQLIHRLPDEYLAVKSKDPIDPNTWVHVGLTYDGSTAANGVSLFVNGEKVEKQIVFDRLKRSILPISEEMKNDSIPLRVGRSYRIWAQDVGLFNGRIDEIKLFSRQLSQWEMANLGEAHLDANNVAFKKEHWSLNDKSLQTKRKELQEIRKNASAVLDSATEVMVMKDGKPRKTHILEKGLYNQLGKEVVPSGVKKVLPYDQSLPQNRLGLAKWLTDPKNPIVSRVAINRYWQMIFGKGLVKTAEDFGSQGSRPTHPELLDWLAKDFIDHNWDVRHALKQMVMSATYRQTSKIPSELREKDPENVYLARSPSYRWPAELIRDNALKSSGLLVEKIGGPSVKPYQPEGLWKEVIMASGKLQKYVPDKGDGLYRRSLYTFSRRFAPNPFMVNFDGTAREICTIRRGNTSTPLQALTLLNDPQFVEASRVMSEKIQKAYPENVEKQIEVAFRSSTGTRPDTNQVETLKGFYKNTLSSFAKSPKLVDSILSVGDYKLDKELSKEKTAAMTMVVNTIYNLSQSYTKR